jgi:predicted 3-demethylubiquinone-9 3-methyltransferase (glyoxalase superfamily)
VTRYGEGAPVPKGTVMTIAFELAGQPFAAINGGPMYTFTEAVSFVVNCDSQEEIDFYWERLTSGGGKPVQCGWLKDRFGLSWQVVPSNIAELFADPAKAARVAPILFRMVKLDMDALNAAAAGR